MKHSEGSRKFREYHEKLEDLQDSLKRYIGLPNMHVVLDALKGCIDDHCIINGDQDMTRLCCCLDWLEPNKRLSCVLYLKAKRELS